MTQSCPDGITRIFGCGGYPERALCLRRRGIDSRHTLRSLTRSGMTEVRGAFPHQKAVRHQKMNPSAISPSVVLGPEHERSEMRRFRGPRPRSFTRQSSADRPRHTTADAAARMPGWRHGQRKLRKTGLWHIRADAAQGFLRGADIGDDLVAGAGEIAVLQRRDHRLMATRRLHHAGLHRRRDMV